MFEYLPVDEKEFSQAQLEPLPEPESNPFRSLDNDFRFIKNKKHYITHSLDGAAGATAANYGVIFNVPFKCYISEVRVSWSTASTSGTLNIEKLTGTQALDAGVEVLAADLSTAGTADTVNTPALSSTISNKNLTIGDRLALKDAGTLSNLVGLCVTIELTQTI